jgi:hypothetical protein
MSYGVPPLTFPPPAFKIAVDTNAVDAAFVVLSPGAGVGTVGVPVNAGDASGAAPISEAAKPVATTKAFVTGCEL